MSWPPSLCNGLLRSLFRTGFSHIEQQSPTFLAPETSFMEDIFFSPWGGGDDSSPLHLLFTLFLLLLHQLHLRSSGVISQRLGTPDLFIYLFLQQRESLFTRQPSEEAEEQISNPLPWRQGFREFMGERSGASELWEGSGGEDKETLR